MNIHVVVMLIVFLLIVLFLKGLVCFVLKTIKQ